MKNIHLLPTEKSSRLYYKDDNYKLANSTMAIDWYISSSGYKPTNIYITSDSEEIKEGEKCITFGSDKCKGQLDTFQSNVMYSRKPHKIILTTDQDLIKDRVQAIDDEFLEWFVKNPSCEYVEVNDSKVVKEHIFDGSNDGAIVWEKKIIIPQEESKQETLTYTEAAKKEERIFNSTMMSKQETLEEVAERLYPRLINDPYNPMEDDNKEDRDTWLKGAKRQAKRMYSEEEVVELLYKRDLYLLNRDEEVELELPNDWFEQFKKKQHIK
jgi:hypothetical protein